MKNILLIIFVQCTLYILHCSAQQQNNFTHFTTEDGLSQSSVFSIVQDETGFMWFATEDGLNKFDGSKFLVFRPDEDDPGSLPALGIRKIYKDKNGKLWILTLRGQLCRYNQLKNNFSTFLIIADKNSQPARIIALAEDQKGKLWAVTAKGEFFFYDETNEKFTLKIIDEKIKREFEMIHVQCLLIARDNTFWIGTWKGLINFDIRTQKVVFYNNSENDPESLAGDMVFGLQIDDNDNIWIASANGGVSVFNKDTGRFKVFSTSSVEKNKISSNRILSLYIDSRKKIWIGTFDKGLDLYDPDKNTFTNFSHNPSISSSFSIGAVMAIFEDKSGGIWFGTAGGGINRFDRLNQNFINIQHIPGKTSSISPNPVLAICEDSKGNLWVGSDGGGINLKLKHSDDFLNYLQNPSFGSNAVTIIYEDSKGNIWVGMDPGTDQPSGVVSIFDRKNNIFRPIHEIKISVGGISAIREDREGELWIATTSDGIHRYNPVTKTEIIYKNKPDDTASIGTNSFFTICEDSEGNIWFGSLSSGLILFEKKKNTFTSFIHVPSDKFSISSNSVWSIAEDGKRNLWIGTWGGGLNKFSKSTRRFTRYSTENGLPSKIVYCVIPDSSGNLWLSTSRGLTKFNEAEKSFQNFDRSNGLLISNFSAGACFKAKNGRFFFGGNSGLISFYPEQVTKNIFVPNVAITGFKIYDKEIDPESSNLLSGEIKLDYDQNFFTIEFASFDFTAPEKNKFEYRLEGVDKDWIKSDGRRFASYTDINNGVYKFRVKGSNSSGIFNPKEAVLHIIILPPFWKTWWFRLFIFILLALILYSLHKYRLNKLLEVERTRNRIARDLHDEVSASITGIVYFADAVKTEVKDKETPALKKLIGLISESASQIQESMSDIIWSINPDNDDWSVVLPKFRRYASDLCESKGIKYTIEMPENLSGKYLKMNQRHDLWLIFKEIVTNAVKHSSCSNVKIKMFNDADILCLQISDDGIGFDSEIPSSNNGLKNIRARVNTLGGVSDLAASQGNGTNWKIRIPLTKQK